MTWRGVWGRGGRGAHLTPSSLSGLQPMANCGRLRWSLHHGRHRWWSFPGHQGLPQCPCRELRPSVGGAGGPSLPTWDIALKSAWSCQSYALTHYNACSPTVCPAWLQDMWFGGELQTGPHVPHHHPLSPTTQLELLCGNAVLSKRSLPNPVCVKPERFYPEEDSGSNLYRDMTGV